MNRVVKWVLGAAVVVAIAGFLIWAFLEGRQEMAHEREREAPIKIPPRVSGTPQGEILVTLDAATRSLIALKTEALAAAVVRPEMAAYGALMEDPALSFMVRAPLAGVLRARSAWPRVGEQIPDGAVAGEIEPLVAPVDRVGLESRLASAEADVAATTASTTAARAAFERAKTLNADNKNVSDSALQDAEAKYVGEEARLKAAQETLQLVRSSVTAARGPTGPMPLAVRHGGEVVEVLAQPGESVGSGQAIFRLLRFDYLLARVELPAGEIPTAPVAAAQIAPVGQESRWFHGVLVTVGAHVDPSNLGRPYIFRIRTAGSGLRPGTAVTAYLVLAGRPEEGVIIPRSAVVEAYGRTWAYVQAGENTFTRREISLNHPAEGGWFMSSGFKAGDHVVVDGAQVLLSEESKSQIQIGEGAEAK
jgi:RND family efflux transporter MFP subunit